MLSRSHVLAGIFLLLAFCAPHSAAAQFLQEHDVTSLRGFHGAGLGKRVTRSFESDSEARQEFSRILGAVGLSWITDRIQLRANAHTANAEAGIEQGKRFIFYNALFMQKVKARTTDHWSLVSILAHEVGHHLAFHTEVTGRWHEFELEADYFSGFVLRRLNASLDQALKAMRDICQKEATKTHPGCDDRLQSITLGWTEGGQSGAPKGFKTAMEQVRPPQPAEPPAATREPPVAASASVADPSKPYYWEMFRGCVREREHFRKDRILADLKRRFSAQTYQYGWLPESVAQRPRVRITDGDLDWHAIAKAEIKDGLLELDYAWRNGKLRLVPVLSKSWGTRSIAGVAIGLQGLWVTDNSFGCIELRLDDAGVGRGKWGVHENVKLDSPVFLRLAPKKAALVEKQPLSVPERKPQAPPPICDGIWIDAGVGGRQCVKPGSGKAFRDCPTCPEMVVVPAGKFMMGSPANEAGRDTDEVQVSVQIDDPFAVGRFEVTYSEWDACLAEGTCTFRPASVWGRRNLPVLGISWSHVKDQFLPWLNGKLQRAGVRQSYRLLSEAEWEYAARAGSGTAYWWGKTITPDQANYDGSVLYPGGAATGKFRERTVPVHWFAPNSWGLYNVLGNAWELTDDCWNESHLGNSANGLPRHSGDCTARVSRGGGWDSPPEFLRAADRCRHRLTCHPSKIGFRIARSLTMTEK